MDPVSSFLLCKQAVVGAGSPPDSGTKSVTDYGRDYGIECYRLINRRGREGTIINITDQVTI